MAGVFAGGHTCTTLCNCRDMICHQMMLEQYWHHLGARLITVLYSVLSKYNMSKLLLRVGML